MKDITGGKEVEEAYQKLLLPATPSLVSTDSSVHHIQGEVGADNQDQDVDMMAGIRSDFVSALILRVDKLFSS